MLVYDKDETVWGFKDHTPEDAPRQKLPAGLYRGIYTGSGPKLVEDPAWVCDEPLQLPDPHTEALRKLTTRFMAGAYRDPMAKIGMLEKLSILMHGPPGTGKSMAVRRVALDAMARDWIVITRWVDAIPHLITKIREREPDRGVCVFVEEFDHAINSSEEKILQCLDGAQQAAKVLFVFTTNNVASVPERILLRTRRITHQFHFGPPDTQTRIAYFKIRFPDRTDIPALAEQTSGLTLDQCAQVVLASEAFGMSVKSVLDDIKDRKAYLGIS